MSGTNKTVLSIGTIQDLLWLREAVLKDGGCKVFSVTDETNAKARIYTHRCDVLLLCYSVHDGVRARITKLFREACPSGRIIAITDQHLQCPPQDADSFLYGVEGTEALIEAVRGTSESSDTSAA
jgi:hypothetical protein